MSQAPQVINYMILSEYEASRLGKQVESAIHEGWQPFGHLTVANHLSNMDGKTATYSQALVKHAAWFQRIDEQSPG